MKIPLKIFLLLACLASLGLIGINPKNPPQKPVEKVASESAFSQAILEQKRKADEEAKKKEEERQYLATYGPCQWVPILMYHHVGENANWLYIDPKTFAGQMDYLVGKGYATLTLPEVASGLASGQLPAKVVVLTFDDGYRDFFTQAYPVLRQHNLKATVFLITQLMEGADYLTWEQAREMAGAGLITLGDHTLDHKSLVSLVEEQIKNEIFSSKRIIEEKTGYSPNVFAYPYGSFSSSAANILGQAGFVAAVTTQAGYSCAKLPLGLRRIRVGRTSLSSYGL